MVRVGAFLKEYFTRGAHRTYLRAFRNSKESGRQATNPPPFIPLPSGINPKEATLTLILAGREKLQRYLA